MAQAKANHDGFLQFVKSSKQDLVGYLSDIESQAGAWRIVMGNEAADLDSLACALATAYWLSLEDENARYVALCRMQRDDLRLRKENQLALKQSGLATEDLVTLEDVADGDALKRADCQYVLVDHNHLAGEFGADEAAVKLIIDHHEDERCHLQANPRIIDRTAGSCSSLVTKHFSQSQVSIPASLADLLVSAILIDTGNLKESGKASALDHEAIAILAPHCKLIPPSLNLAVTQHEKFAEYFSQLRRAKSDISDLSIRDNLRRDYKEYPDIPQFRLGISSIPMSLDALAASGDLIESLRAWREERNLALVAVGSSFQKAGKGTRELLLHGEQPFLDKVARKLEADTAEVLSLEEMGRYRANESIIVFDQHNTRSTRKQIAPALKSILKSLSSS